MTPLQAGRELAVLADQVRADAAARGAVAASQTFKTADGEITVDYRADDFLRITFTGDAPERSYLLAPDWPQGE